MGWVLFFDGDCAFCNASVRRVVAFDKGGHVAFSPLQGKLAAELGFQGNAAKDGTMVLMREADGRVFTRSDALIELARALGGWWRLTTVAQFIPRCLRDWVYRGIAKNRYRFMGKSATCSLPDPELLKRLRD